MTTASIPGLGAIGTGEAIDLLVRTSTNNITGRIGGPFTRDGYTIESATAMLERAGTVTRGVYQGIPTIVAVLPDQGAHVWYLNLVPPRAEPWG